MPTGACQRPEDGQKDEDEHNGSNNAQFANKWPKGFTGHKEV